MPTDRAARLDLAAVVLVAVAATGLRAYLAIRHPGPIVYEDEWGYFRLGAWLAGEGTNPVVAYYPGYPLLLVPAFLLSGSGFGAFDLAVGTNLLLVPIGVALAVMTVRRVAPDAPRGVLVGAVSAFALYPPLVIYSGLTWAENSLPLLILATALTCGFAARRGGWAWAVPAVPAGAAFLTHPRGLVCAIALVVVVLAAVLLRSIRWSEAAIALAATGGGLVLATFCIRLLTEPGDHYKPESLSPIRLLHDPRSGFAALSGVLLYAVISTVGLLVAGLASGVSAAAKIVRREHGAGEIVSLYLGLCCLGLIAFSTLSASAGLSIRGDYLVYGRYGEPGYAVMLVTGISWLGSGSRRRLLALGLAPVVAAAGAWGVVHLAPPGSLALPVNYVNVLSLVVYLVRAGGLHPYAIVAWSLPAMLALAIAFVAVRRTAWLVPLVVALAFVGTVRSAVRHWLTLVTAQSAAVRVIPQAIDDLAAGSGGLRCVAFHTTDLSGVPGWRVKYFTGIPVKPAATEAEAAAACNGVWLVPKEETATLGTVVDTAPDERLVVSNPAYLRELGR